MFPLIFLLTEKNLRVNTMKKSFLLITISSVMGVMFLLPFTLFGILNTGNITGLLFSGILFFYGVFFEKANESLRSLWKKRQWKVILSFFAIVITVAVIFTAVTTTKMFIAANNPAEKETTVIVLGCKVNPNGPSLSLVKRLEAAYDYLIQNPELSCILSGGQGADEPMSEAQAMYDWLTAKGIDKERLYLENKSKSTYENLVFSKKIIEKEALPEAVTIITNDFHQYRAQKIAERYYKEVYGISGDTPPYLLPMYYIRELGGIFVELCFYS